jgi:D-sedoheptulose 7-phosphate isomerase
MATIGMTGEGGGRMASLCDVLIDVPSRVTPRVQEMHLVIYHFLCEQIELALVKEAT